ncbi:MAG: D-tyrosyl-tRNA(Tyr) deacylase [Oscillospiraceae bacterium]|nr:D-tyrosyl-tRNA(Tyr) deacylase [Oscillospiraceae bacterium]
MKAVVQRVKNAGVTVEGKEISRIGKGYMILLGVMDDDTVEDIDILAKKISTLRVFEDENGKMNLDIKSIDGEILAISQFTLCADVKKGNRPSFIRSKEPETARGYYEIFCEKLIEYGVRDVKKGVFGADMKVDLINDGPVTIVYDTEIWVKR